MSIEFQYSDEQYENGYKFQNWEGHEFFVGYKKIVGYIKEKLIMDLDVGTDVRYNIEPFSYVKGGKLTRIYLKNNQPTFGLWHLKGVPTELEKFLLEYEKETLAPRREQRGNNWDVPPYPGGGMGGGMGGGEEKTQLRL